MLPTWGCAILSDAHPSTPMTRREGWQVYRQLEHYRVPPEFETMPTAKYACPADLNKSDNAREGAHAQPSPCQPATHPDSPPSDQAPAPTKVPKLLKTYLAIGARIGGPPAWDREFGTIDFFTFLDLKMLSASARNRFLAPLTQ